VAAFPPPGVFVNYRRDDTGPYARLLQLKLAERFPGVPVFMDLDSIEAGVDFAKAIKSGVDECAVLVALIGAKWLTITDEDGRRRLDDPDDYVRYEIRAALERCTRVIPVLVDGARPPKRQELPDDLQALARLNALDMSYVRFDYDVKRLMDVIQRVLKPGGANEDDRGEAARLDGRPLTGGDDHPAVGRGTAEVPRHRLCLRFDGGPGDVVSREGADRLKGLPEGAGGELDRVVAVKVATQQVGAAILGGTLAKVAGFDVSRKLAVERQLA
jgi:hypothetical protein